MIPTAPDSKPIIATDDEIELTAAYALLRQVRFHLAQPNPLPSAIVDVKTAVNDFCDDFEASMRQRARNPSPASMPEIPAITQPSGDVRAESVAGNSTLISD